MSHKKGLSLKIKSFVCILVMSVVFCAAAVAASTYVFSDTNESLFKKHAENIAYTAAANADAENIKKITDMVLETFKTVKDDKIINVSSITAVRQLLPQILFYRIWDSCKTQFQCVLQRTHSLLSAHFALRANKSARKF